MTPSTPAGSARPASAATALATVAEQLTVVMTRRWLRVPTRPSARTKPRIVRPGGMLVAGPDLAAAAGGNVPSVVRLWSCT